MSKAVLSGPPFPCFDGAPATLASLLRSRADQNPDSRFIELDRVGFRSTKTAAELHALALQLLEKLRICSAEGCDIVLCFESALDFVPATWACVYGGYACLPWHIPKSTDDGLLPSRLQLFREKLRQPVLVTRHSVWSQLASLGPSPFRSVVLIDRDEEIDLEGQAPSESSPPFPPRERSSSAFLLLTSGTTRAPKIAITGHNCLLNRFLAWERSVLPGPRLFSKPFDSVAGLGIILANPRGNLFLQPERAAVRAGDYLSAIEEFRIRSIGISSSAAIRILAAAHQHADRDLSSLESIALGAEMIVPRVALDLGVKLKEMGATKLGISFVYGMTETGTLCRKPNQTLDEVRESQQVSPSVGGCTAGYSIRIVDESGEVLPPGHVGGIEVWSGEKLFSGYLNDPGVDQESFAKDGWFKTGDVGLVERGELRLTGRQKSTIVINAKKFSLEAIEASLRDTEGIHRSLVAAGPFRSEHSATDELAVFFVPSEAVPLDHICRRILRVVGRQGVSAKHLVPLKESDFPLTATGKAHRDKLMQQYQSGKWPSHRLSESDSRQLPAEADRQSWLLYLWRKVLNLDFFPGLEDNFFDLGGDSLASAELIIAVEERFSCQIAVEAFFQSPTVATLDGLIEPSSPAQQRPGVLPSADRPLYKLQILVRDWKGRRLFPESLIIGLNHSGTQAPIFWVFQDLFEFTQLAKHLGPDQPLYGMRSCVGIVRPRDYWTVIDAVCTRYFLEILSLALNDRFSIGGNCQGAILSLELARRLAAIGRNPSLLILTEWSYSYGNYPYPTLLLYGNQSHTADIYRQKSAKIDWRGDFPTHSVAPIPGRYGELFAEGNIPEFAAVLKRYLAQIPGSRKRTQPHDTSEVASPSDPTNSSGDKRNDDYAVVDGPRGLNRNWYLKHNPDVADAGVDPVVHYLEYGWREGRDPRPDFSTTGYLVANEDVARAGCNPLVHYIRWGFAEGRALGLIPASIAGGRQRGDPGPDSALG